MILTWLWLLVIVISPGAAWAQAAKPVSLEVTAPKTTLREGETVQLKVIVTFADGSTMDVTSTESRLIPEPDGRVTCIGTDGKPEEIDIIGVKNGKLDGSIEFKLLPSGPGPGL